jgi:hypothetical protein
MTRDLARDFRVQGVVAFPVCCVCCQHKFKLFLPSASKLLRLKHAAGAVEAGRV